KSGGVDQQGSDEGAGSCERTHCNGSPQRDSLHVLNCDSKSVITCGKMSQVQASLSLLRFWCIFRDMLARIRLDEEAPMSVTLEIESAVDRLEAAVRAARKATRQIEEIVSGDLARFDRQQQKSR